MSAEARLWAWGQDLPHVTHKVLVALADLANEKQNHTAWPSKATLMGMTNLSRRGLMLQLRMLEQAGYITCKTRQRENKSYRSSLYFLHMGTGHELVPPTGHDVCPTLGHELVPHPRAQAGAPLEPNIEPNIEPKNESGEPQEDQMSKSVLDWVEGDDQSKEDIFAKAMRKNGRLTADGCAFLWRHCRANAASNGFQAEIISKDRIKLRTAYDRIGEDFPEIVWAVMANWISFTKYAEKYTEAFNCPRKPSVPFFVKFIESALNFTQSNQNSQEDTFVQLTAKPEELLTVPLQTADNSDNAISSEELLAMSKELGL